jgi:hypothetical protein
VRWRPSSMSATSPPTATRIGGSIARAISSTSPAANRRRQNARDSSSDTGGLARLTTARERISSARCRHPGGSGARKEAAPGPPGPAESSTARVRRAARARRDRAARRVQRPRTRAAQGRQDCRDPHQDGS